MKITNFSFLSFLVFPREQSGVTYENGTHNNNIRQTSASPTFNSLPRTTTPQKALYSNGNGSATSGNLSELDSLLQDLSNARYGSNIEKKRELTFALAVNQTSIPEHCRCHLFERGRTGERQLEPRPFARHHRSDSTADGRQSAG